jgi:hypothetical protein
MLHGRTIRLCRRRFLFVADFSHLVDAIDNAKMGAVIPSRV